MSSSFFLTEEGRPAVIAHRGGGPALGVAGHLENTLDALFWGVANGADWLECDLQISSDGDIMLTHDVVRDGAAIRSRTTRELLDLGLDTLADAHAKLPPHIGLDLDIKVSLFDARSPGQGDFFTAVVDTAERMRGVRPIALTSFCPSVTQLQTDLPRGWLANRTAWYYETVVSAARLGLGIAGVHADDVREILAGCPTAREVSDFARAHDIAILAWGVEPDDVGLLVQRGVTGLIGDDVPGIAAAVAEL